MKYGITGGGSPVTGKAVYEDGCRVPDALFVEVNQGEVGITPHGIGWILEP